MSNLQVATVCIQCKKHFLSKKKGSRFCSNVCRAQYSRDGRLSKLKSQDKVIKTQARIIDAVIPKQEIKQPSSHLSYSRNPDQINKIIRELNVMRAEAEQAAISAGRGKEHWSPYVKDSERFQQLCRMIQNMSK